MTDTIVTLTEGAVKNITKMRDDLVQTRMNFGERSPQFIEAASTLAFSLSSMLTMHQLDRIMAEGDDGLVCSAFITVGMVNHPKSTEVYGGTVYTSPSWSLNS